MRRYSIKIANDLMIRYNHYLSDIFLKNLNWNKVIYGYKIYTMFTNSKCKMSLNNKVKDDEKKFMEAYPLIINSRKFDKPAIKNASNQSYHWYVDDKLHRIGSPAVLLSNGRAIYCENGNVILINPEL